MRRYSNILVPVDGTSASEYALRQACALARPNGSRVLAVIPFFSKQERDIAYEGLAADIKAVSSEEGVAVEVLAQQGRPSSSVIDAAEQRGNDLIVLGKMDMNMLEQIVIKSFTGRVIGHSTCDIIVIPENVPLKWDSLLVCTDGSKYSESAVSETIGIAKLHGSTITALSVVPSEAASPLDIVHSQMQRKLIVDKELKAAETNVKNVRELAEKEGVAVSCLILAGKPYDAIVETAKSRNVSLIVVGSHGRTGLGKLLMGSVAVNVISLSRCPVLVVRCRYC